MLRALGGLGKGRAYFVTETAHSGTYGLLIHHQSVHKKGQKSVYQTPDECSVVCARVKEEAEKAKQEENGMGPFFEPSTTRMRGGGVEHTHISGR